MARKTWWPLGLAEQLALMMNVLAKITGHQAALGLTNAQRVKIEELCNSFISVYNYVEQQRETAGALIEWRQDCFYRPGGGAQDAPPGFSAFAPPAGAVAGCVDEFKEQRDMIVNIPGVPVAVLEDLMFVGDEKAPNIPGSAQPSVKATSAATGYLASVVVSDREDADGWEAWKLDKGAANWVLKGTYNGKSTDIVFAPATLGDPYQFQIRIQLRKGNANYGQPSDAVTVTVNP